MPREPQVVNVELSNMPSNAPEGWPTVGPDGYNLWYQISGDGTVDTSKPVRLILGTTTYADAQEIADLPARLAHRHSGLERERRHWLEQQHTGPIAATGLTGPEPDLPTIYYLRVRHDERRYAGLPGDLFEMALSGSNADVARVRGLSLPLPADFDAEAYQSRLREIIDAINQAPDQPVAKKAKRRG